jgi:hypothetical protein
MAVVWTGGVDGSPFIGWILAAFVAALQLNFAIGTQHHDRNFQIACCAAQVQNSVIGPQRAATGETEMATRYAITDGREYWTRNYSHDTGNMTCAEKATTWASKAVAEVKLQERRSYLCMTGRHNAAAALQVVAVPAA